MRLLPNPNVIKTDNYFISAPKTDYEKLRNEIVEKAQREAEKILNDANETKEKYEKESKELLAAAEKTAEEIKQKAYIESKAEGLEKGTNQGREIGFKQGYADAVSKFNEKIGDLLERFNDAVETVYNSRENVINQQESYLPDIVFAVCSEVVGYSIDLDVGVVERMVEKALENYRNEEWINIYFSSDIYAKMLERKDEFLDRVKSISTGVKIFPCRDFDDTDCVIELKKEVLDLSAKSQLEKIKKALKK